VSDQTSIFNNQNQPTQANQDSGGASTSPNGNQSNQLADLLSSIKNDRGETKYKSVEDALNALKHSQDYIPQLSDKLRQQEQELAEAKAAAAKITELENTLKALTQQNNTPASQPATPGLSEEQIASLVTQTLTRQQQAEVSKQNLSKVVSAVTSAFGEKSEEVFYGKAKELGMSVEDINALAARTPIAALKLLGLDNAGKPPTPNQGSINTSAFQPTQETFVSKNAKPTLIGATSSDLREESINSRKMVDELHSQGLTVHDLTDPKVYFKHFK
jgi:hypothetical protein